jgi:hypothetical protein
MMVLEVRLRASQRLRFESRRDNMNMAMSAHCVSPGDWVKVGALGERFWFFVNTVHTDGILSASVDNDLVSCPWTVGDEVTFHERNVVEVASSTDRDQFEHVVVVSGSHVNGAKLWHHWRQLKGIGVTFRPGTQHMVGDEII